MIYIAGVGVLEPRGKLKRFLKKQKSIKDFIKDFVNRTSAFDMYARTKKLLDVTQRTIPNIPINSIFWPTGANRFAVGVFLVTERAASYIFAMSAYDSRQTVAYDLISTDVAGFSSHCFAQLAAQSPSQTPSGGVPDRLASDPAEAAAIMASGTASINLMPVPVVVTQRSRFFEPFKYQSYFATWMIPIIYIPIVDNENIRVRDEYISGRADGFGLLIMTDHRFLWHFISIPQALFASLEMNDCYFNWYKLLNLLRGFLMPEQTSTDKLTPYGRSFFVDTIDPIDAESDDPCKLKAENPNKIEFDDDRAYWGPPIDLWSEGIDLTLAEMFALIEQSLSKRLLFHPNWQVEFVNSVVARKRMIRNLLMFTPRVVYPNEDLFGELEVAPPPKDTRFTSELPIQSGGLIKNYPTASIEINPDTGAINVRNDRMLPTPEPRYPITLPHMIEVVGSLYLTPDNEIRKPTPSNDGALYYPLQYTYYRAILASKDQVKVPDPDQYDWLEDGDFLPRSYDPVGNLTTYQIFQNIFIPGPLMGLNSKANYDVSKLRILTTHLCTVWTEADFTKKETKDESPWHINKKPSWKLGRAIVRDFIGWCLFPFTWHFKNACYWPLTGYEDYLLIRSNGSVYVKGYHAHLISGKTGIKYVGWQSPAAVSNVVKPHALLDGKIHHIDGSEDSPIQGAVVGAYPKGGTIEIPGFTLNGQKLRAKATIWSAIEPPQ